MTGGAGFIGANLCRRLGADGGDDVVVVDDLSTGDLDNLRGLDAELVEGAHPRPRRRSTTRSAGRDAVVHLAARPSVPRSIADPVASHLANATGTVEVLEAARRRRATSRASWRRRRRCTAPTRRCRSARTSPPCRSARTRPASSPPRRTRSPTSTRSGCPRSRSGSSTCSVRCRPPATRTRRWSPRSSSAALDGPPAVVHGDGQAEPRLHLRRHRHRGDRRRDHRAGSRPEPVNLAFGTRTDLLELIAELEDHPGHAGRDRAHRDARRRRQALAGRLHPSAGAVPRRRPDRTARGPRARPSTGSVRR